MQINPNTYVGSAVPWSVTGHGLEEERISHHGGSDKSISALTKKPSEARFHGVLQGIQIDRIKPTSSLSRCSEHSIKGLGKY